MQDALEGLKELSIELANGDYLCDQNNVVCLYETADQAQHVVNRPAKTVVPVGMCFALSTGKVLLQDWTNLILGGDGLMTVGRFSSFGGRVSKAGKAGL